ncbi:MAG: hypothetical protein ACXU8A_00030 [Burkholderiaceae bacterium]
MSTVYIPPMSPQQKAEFFADMLARDYRCKVTVSFDDGHGVSFSVESDHGVIDQG